MQQPLLFEEFVTPPINELVAANEEIVDVEVMAEQAISTLFGLLDQGHPLVLAFSAGKDSSVCLDLALKACARFALTGKRIPSVVLSHGDTLMEQPEMTQHARKEIEKAKNYASKHGFTLQVSVATPGVNSEFWVRVISGLKTPSFPGMKHDCTTDLKILPMRRMRKQLLSELRETGEPVTVVGTRYDESQARANRMTEREETADKPRLNESKELIISPIAYWTTDNVWEYLGLVRGGVIEGYSDFDETFRIYADAGGTTCAVVSDMVTSSMKSSRPCGTRTGCWACTPIGDTDKSMENLLASDPRYEYMRGLNKLRNYLFAIRWDFSKRTWVPKSIVDGYVAIRPDNYSPEEQRNLLRYAITLDVEECEAAARLGIEPRFLIISMQAMIAIDCYWSINAMQRPFTALKIWKEIWEEGARYPIPEIDVHPKEPLPAPRFFHVGDNWDEGVERVTTGLRDPLLEEFAGAGCMGTKTLANGRVVMDVHTDQLFSVDGEGAYLMMAFESDDLIRRYYHDEDYASATCFMYYARLGTISISKGQHSEIDRQLRRAAFKQRHGMAYDVNPMVLLEKCKPADFIPPTFRKAMEKKRQMKSGNIVPLQILDPNGNLIPCEQMDLLDFLIEEQDSFAFT